MSILRRNILLLSCIVFLGSIGIAGAGAAPADPSTGFFRALRMDDPSTVGRLLAAKTISPNAIDPISGESALIVALREGALQVVDVLLAEPTLQLEVNAPNGNTALMMASFRHNAPAVRALLARGAIVNRPGYTALHFAAAAGDDEITKILLDHFAYIDAEAPAKYTPLMMAAREGHESTVGLLLEEGADASLKNSESLTASQIAERADKPRVVAVIAKFLAGRK